MLFLEDERAVGGMDDPVVDLAIGLGLEQQRFGLGTPDLAAASKLVADEHQHGPSRLRLRCKGKGEAAKGQKTTCKHDANMR